MIMSPMVSGFLTALPVVLVGVAVLLLALDARMNRFIRAEHARRLDQHAEVLADVQHADQVRARHDLAVADQFALASHRSSALG